MQHSERLFLQEEFVLTSIIMPFLYIHVHVYSFLEFSTEAFVYDNTFPGKYDKKRNNFADNITL